MTPIGDSFERDLATPLISVFWNQELGVHCCQVFEE